MSLGLGDTCIVVMMGYSHPKYHSFVSMVIKQSQVLGSCTEGTSGLILIGGDNGALV